MKLDNQPVPYGVLLKADGDHMAALLNNAETVVQSQEISKVLHGFACEVRKIVQRHRGHAIYAGGDDVLAFLPLQQALDCAEELASKFSDIMKPVARDLGLTLEQFPTLSVGLAIGHIIQPMRRLRNRAVDAEKHAKGNDRPQPRNALAIHLGIRSGHELSWRCRWDDEASLSAMEQFIQAYRNEQCPSRIGYDLRAVADRLQWVGGETLPGIHQAELERMLDRANLPGGDGLKLAQALKETLLAQARSAGISTLADQLIIARWLSSRTSADIGVLE